MPSVHHLETHTHKTGIAFAEKDGFSLYLVILPKSWNPNQNRKGQFSKCSSTWTTENRFLLNLYENQRVELTFEGSEESKTHVLNLLLDKVSATSANQSSTDVIDDYHTELITDITKRTYNSTRFTDCVIVQNTDNITSVVSLLQLVQHSQFSTVDQTSFDTTQNQMLLPLLHYLFTKEMQTVQRYIRRGYVPTSEKIRAIRGRPDMRSVAKAEASGGTEVLCHYDEFEESTPLMRILVTALDIVAGGNWLTHMSSDVDNDLTISNTGEQSTDLRRTLHSIPSMIPSQALTVHRRIRLNRGTQIFARALSLAKHILADSQILPTQSETLSEEAWCWDVDMSDVWESILVQGFQKCRGINVSHYDQWCTNDSVPNTVYRAPIKAPFTDSTLSNRRPDILLTHQTKPSSHVNWIIDAKYSYFDQVPKNASREYQNQMLGYAYLTKDDEKPWVHQLALIYSTNRIPTQNDINQSKINGVWDSDWSNKPSLFQTLIQFPGVEYVQKSEYWNAYINEISNHLLIMLETDKSTSENK